jgi:S1-C subfamily serine protease
VRIGRRPDNDVVFDPNRDRKVSGHHAEIVMGNGVARLKDLGSNNGTFVNGVRVTSTVTLQNNDVVSLGESGPRLQVRLTQAASAGSAKPAAGAAKKGVGQQTLQRAIEAATVKERSRTRSTVALLVLFVIVLAAGAGAYYWQTQAEVQSGLGRVQQEAQRASQAAEEASEQAASAAAAAREVREQAEKAFAERLDRYESELAALEGKLTAGESRVARLIVEVQERHREMEKLQRRQDLSDAEREKLLEQTRKKLTSLDRELQESQKQLRRTGNGARVDWATLVDRYKRGIFLIAALDPNAGSVGTGTAFCVRSDGLLATNAHVVKMVQSMPVIFAVQNDTGRYFEIRRSVGHAGFSGVHSPDVGLIQLKGNVHLPALALAGDADLRNLRIGTELGTLGYPGELQAAYLSKVDRSRKTVDSALATFKTGWVGRITGYDLARADHAAGKLLQHSASLSGGTSGSPMFTADGKVVALNNGGLDQQVVVKQGSSQGVVRTPSAAEIGFAIRVDELRALMQQTGW